MVLPAAGHDQLAAYQKTLAGTYTKSIRAVILDRNGDVVVPSLEGQFQGGQVLVDAGQDVTRSSTVTLVDPLHKYGFDADTYQGDDLNLTRMLRIWWIVDSPLLAHRVSVPVMTGPLSKLTREGALVTVEAQGKEILGLTPTRRTLTIKKGARRTDAIKTILRELMGETRLGHIPDLPARLPDQLVIGPKDLAWKKAKKLAHSLNRELFYGGNGVPYLRKRPGSPSWTFRGGADGDYLRSPLHVEADLQKVRNHVKVTGATPKGKKKPVTAQATAERSHPLSPWSLGPSGVPIWLVDEVSNPHLRTVKECQDIADTRLERHLKLTGDVSFNSVPIPHLEPLDLIKATDPFETSKAHLRTFTLPLGVGEDMTVGYVDPFTLHRRYKQKSAPWIMDGGHAGKKA